MSHTIVPFSLKNSQALIERLLPVQKLCAEAYKEQMANVGKTLTALGSYYKGRKPLILNKACIIGCLLPATDDLVRDLEIFEKLMAMDAESFVIRWTRRPKPKEILGNLAIERIDDYFTIAPEGILPASAPIDWSKIEYAEIRVSWRNDISELKRRRLEAQALPKTSYREQVVQAKRPEEVMDTVHDHIWGEVNAHLGTYSHSFPELVEQLGIMRFGHRPRLADTFCGSGQIAFEAARLGCDVYASDLNPVACMLTWGAFNIVGGSTASRVALARQQQDAINKVRDELDRLGVETDGKGWRIKALLYCLEARCPQTGWMVPLIPSLVISRGKRVIAELVPDSDNNRYDITVRTGVSTDDLARATRGTVRSDGRGQEPSLIHTVDGIEYRTKISTLRGDFRNSEGFNGNRLRLWEKTDFKPRADDIYQDRVYAIHWMRPKDNCKGYMYDFRSVTAEDLARESIVEEFLSDHLTEWQDQGWIPDMRIEHGYNTDQPIRERGWTHWHHLFNPRQLLVNGLINRYATTAELKFGVNQAANWNSKLSTWDGSPGVDTTHQTFYNQALNSLFTYGTRASAALAKPVTPEFKTFPVRTEFTRVECASAVDLANNSDMFITDPPYGDAVNYEEILEFFIAWLRKNPSPEFGDWVWDSRRALAIKGSGEDFRRGMVAAYKRTTDYMPDNGIQVIMFTHQSGSMWADMANIVWASGLQVTAAWYVVTETDSPLREGSYVKGTVILVLRKRLGKHKINRDDLAWEIEEEVEAQVKTLAGLNQQALDLYRDENVFEDADIQMAGYAAALRVLTRYTIIDGRDMTTEAIRPRVSGETTFVDGLIAFAVATANQCLVPQGITQTQWDKLSGPERFYLKMLDLEARGAKMLDNYQNFAKAFKVRDFRSFMASQRANAARLKTAVEFGRGEISEGSEMYQSVLRAVLYAMMELAQNVDGSEVLAHLTLNVPNYYGDMTQRELVGELANYLAEKLLRLRSEEASAARVLRELVKNQRLG